MVGLPIDGSTVSDGMAAAERAAHIPSVASVEKVWHVRYVTCELPCMYAVSARPHQHRQATPTQQHCGKALPG